MCFRSCSLCLLRAKNRILLNSFAKCLMIPKYQFSSIPSRRRVPQRMAPALEACAEPFFLDSHCPLLSVCPVPFRLGAGLAATTEQICDKLTHPPQSNWQHNQIVSQLFSYLDGGNCVSHCARVRAHTAQNVFGFCCRLIGNEFNLINWLSELYHPNGPI